ncbi:AAA domain-containing protein [Planomicrobium okeanokoites]|uniref:AAA domain-containing protein n=1 Tax=Planomicrobium okeanokoites TaxID=244 RepID=UPI00249102CC|nr:AAA domain-containing protein [Planomicrobium okeanokoites]
MTKTATPKDAAHLIKYIKGLTELTQKPVYNYSKYDEVLWSDSIPDENETEFTFPVIDDKLLFVKKPYIPNQPAISESLKNWVIFNKSKTEISLKPKIEIAYTNNNGETAYKEYLLTNSPKIQKEFDLFVETRWIPYINELNRVTPIQDLYDKLFEIHQSITSRSESIQLIFAIGLLSWNTPNNRDVKRHVLTSEVEMKFDREKALFSISPSLSGLELSLEEDMLEVEHRLNRSDLNHITEMLESINDEESNTSSIESILKAIVSSLDSQGVFSNEISRNKTADKHPVISLSPSFILRERPQKSIQKACDQAIEQLEQLEEGQEIPGSLINMFSPSNDDVQNTDTTSDTEAFEQEFYFPLPSNEEQSRIVSAITKKASVLVQGPPGTGKTHTIANLTSHLLATGQRVLITSQTAKALSVLKEKLPKELQSLCVSLLGGDSTSLKDLETVVSTISSKKEFYESDKTLRNITQKEEALKLLKQELNQVKTDLFAVREKETYSHDLGIPYVGTAQKIANILNKEEEAYQWYYNENITRLTEEDIKKEKNAVSNYLLLLNENLDIPSNYKNFTYPSIDHFFDFEMLSEAIEKEKILKDSYEKVASLEEVEIQEFLKNLKEDELKNLNMIFNEYSLLTKGLYYNNYPFLMGAKQDIFNNRMHKWTAATEQLASQLKIYQDNLNAFDASLVEFGDIPLKTVQIINNQLIELFESGKGLGNIFFKPKVLKEYKDEYSLIRYNGQQIKDINQAQVLRAYISSEQAFSTIKELLDSLSITVQSVNREIDIAEFNNILDQLNQIIEIGSWRQRAIQTFEFITAANFDEGKIKLITDNIDVFEKKNALMAATYPIQSTLTALSEILSDSTHLLYQNILTHLSNRNKQSLLEEYETYQYFQKIINRDEILEQNKNYLLENNPTLFSYLADTADDPAWNDRILQWNHAAHWLKVKMWLKDFSDRSEQKLSEEFNRTENQIKSTISDIGALKAWDSMLTAMTSLQNSHLKAWTKAVKRVGKGTGKNAPRYRREAQQHMEKCKDAIPAWIMPLYQVFENFEVKPDLFDVVIIDEASQSWHEAILLKYIAKKIIIVGDDKQISPSKIGIQVEDVAKLQNRYLAPINYPFMDTLNLGNSFFDVAYVLFRNTITLREHFRCMPEIIEFSNRIAYIDQPLFALRQYPANRLKPIMSRYLPHGVREGGATSAINEVEAKEIVKEIKICLSNPKYNGKSIGVISLQGNSQANLIQQLLLSEVGAEIMEERNIICGDAYAFQGDERDIIFLSMVAAKGTTRITALTGDTYRQRFNVAVSRAKDQIWLMHSITVNDINNADCMRYQLLNYIQNPLKEEQDGNREKCDSQFEKDVFDAIVRKGYRVLTQYEVAGYRIDLVVMGENTKLAVECDGDYWHTSPEDMENDFRRQRVLERAGWNFWRVLGSTYYINKTRSLESLWQQLDEMGIQPYAKWNVETDIVTEATDVTLTISEENVEKIKQEISNDSHANSTEESKEVTVSDSSENLAPTLPKTNTNDEFHNKEISINPVAHDLSAAISILEDTEVKGNNQLEPSVLKFKNLLIDDGFIVLTDINSPNTLYVMGNQDLRQELDRISPKNNAFTFHKKGLPVSKLKPVWSISFESAGTDILKPAKANKIPPTQINNLSNQGLSKSSTVDQMLGNLKTKGYQIVDNRKTSETIWIVGNEELKELLIPFQHHYVFFRFMKNGSAATSNRPGWFAKIRK